MAKNKKEKITTSINIKVMGYEIERMIEKLIEEKLGEVDIGCIEFTTEKVANKYILNHDDNEYSIYVEYTRG